MSLTSGLRTWIEIDTKAIKNNYLIFRKIIPKSTKLMSVVKSNAYGHGLARFSKEISKLGVDWLGVDSVVEALRLREEGIKRPILVLGYTLPEMLEIAAKNNISVAVSSFESLKYIAQNKFSKKLKIHIKIDSGMHRQGFLPSDLSHVLKLLGSSGYKLQALTEGLFSHFAGASDPALRAESLAQIEIFKEWMVAFEKAEIKVIKHMSATGATMLLPEAHFDMVRIGIGMYGLWPSKEVKDRMGKKYNLKPVLSWKTVISEKKSLKKGESVGYDFTEKLSRDSTVAVCPIGYWHGYPRALSKIGAVLVCGKRAKVLGRVSMDMILVDITDISKARIHDEVVIIGKSGKEYLGAENIARLLGGSWYEVITRINPLIQKFYI